MKRIKSGEPLANDYVQSFWYKNIKHGSIVSELRQYSSVDQILNILKASRMHKVILRQSMWAKFYQNNTLREMLINTGSDVLVFEADKRVGKILMEIRDLFNLTIDERFTWLIKDKLAVANEKKDEGRFDIIVKLAKDTFCKKKKNKFYINVNIDGDVKFILQIAYIIYKCILNNMRILIVGASHLIAFTVLHYFYEIDFLYLLNKEKNFKLQKLNSYVELMKIMAIKFGIENVTTFYFIGNPCILNKFLMEFITDLVLITKTKTPPVCIEHMFIRSLNCAFNGYTTLKNIDFLMLLELDCSHNKLTNDIYTEYAANLQSLDASNNNITQCPSEKFSHTLKILKLDNNKLIGPPVDSVIVDTLLIKNCGLKSLPFKLAPNLLYLDASENPNINVDILTRKSLPILESLLLNNCNIKRLPRNINLKHLHISHNENIELKGLENMYNLNYLDISFCNLKEIPRQIFMLCKLNALNISGNPITEIPDEITNLTELKSLIHDDVPLKKFPLYLSIKKIIDKPISPIEEEKFYIKKGYKCEDPFSLEEIEDNKDIVVFHIILPDNKTEQEFCFSVNDYIDWINKTSSLEGYAAVNMFSNIFAEWRRKFLISTMTDEGINGEPDLKKLLFKDPLNNFLINIPNVHITREFYLLKYEENVRLGNTRGFFGISMHHGQIPGFTTYVAVSKDLFDGKMGTITRRDTFGRIKADDPLIEKYIKRFTIDDCSIPRDVM